MYAYLNASNDVVGTSITALTLAQAQALQPSIVSIVANAPVELVAVGQESTQIPFHHRLVSGSGTSISDYEAVNSYTYSVSGDTLNGLVDLDRLAYEVERSAVGTNFLRVGRSADNVFVVFSTALTSGGETELAGVIAVHNGRPLRPWRDVVVDPTIEPVVPGASKVVTNDRPAIEIASEITGYGAIQQVWPLVQDDDAELRVKVKFILKESGTGASVRIVVRMKTESTGGDSSESFSATEFVVVPVTFTLIGEIFEAIVTLDASTAEDGDALALQIGRDGANSLGAGADDDVSSAIQIIALKVEAH